MTDMDDTIDTTELAAALNWRSDKLELLVSDARVQADIRSLCSVATALREGVPPTGAFHADTLTALRRERMGDRTEQRAHNPRVGSIRGMIAGGLTFSFASLATVLALLATGVQVGGTSPLAVLVTGVLVGTFASWSETRRLSEVDPNVRTG